MIVSSFETSTTMITSFRALRILSAILSLLSIFPPPPAFAVFLQLSLSAELRSHWSWKIENSCSMRLKCSTPDNKSPLF